ncbi:SpoIIE family protein phosphatase [Microscilla marina]|nr:SpoIIE family protein phosphatase [Microscilla marina]
MKKVTTCIFFLFTISLAVFAQKSPPDNIIQRIEDFAKKPTPTKAPKTSLGDLLAKLKDVQKKEDSAVAFSNAKDIAQLTKKYTSTELQAVSNASLAYAYAFGGKNSIKAFELMKQAIAKAGKRQRKDIQGYLYHELAHLQSDFKNDDAIKSFLKAHDLFLEIKKNTAAARSLYQAGIMQYGSDLGLDIKIKTFREVIKLGGDSLHHRNIIDSHTAIAMMHIGEKKYNEAEKELSKAMEISVEKKDSAWIGILSGNFAQIYEVKKEYDKALKYLKVDLHLSKKHKERSSVVLVYTSIGDVYFAKKKYNLSQAYYDSSVVHSKVDYYRDVGKKDIFYPGLLRAYRGLAKLNAAKKKFEQAYEYRTLAGIMRDTLNRRRLRSKVNQIQSAYNLDKKQKEVLLLTKENDLKEATIQRQNLFNIAVGIGLFLVLVLAIVLYRSAQIRKKKNSLLKEQQNEIMTQNEELFQQQEEILAQQEFVENQNKELSRKNLMINQSINSAQLIQEAILPYESKLNSLLKDYFIFYRPKDIVSGDFYWLNKIEHKTILIAADCTGHGVPGAFMSLISNTLFDKIVRVWGITEASEILKKAQSEIRILLRQQELGYANGMDVCLVVMKDTPQGQVKVQFAGAKRPLYYIKNGESTLQEIRGTRMSIGGRERKDRPSFTQTELLLDKGSILYLGSDGYADQNNQKRKAFAVRNLKLLLEKISAQSMPEQKQILNKTLDAHMKGTEQRDDIMLIGVKLS